MSSLPFTKRVLATLQDVSVEEITEAQNFKRPLPMTEAKKELLITRFEGTPLKACQGAGDYVCCNYFTVAFASNCHFECSYCILQDYLKNNPAITLYANVDEILGHIENHLTKHPEELIRMGTGELADSLALDDITQLSRDLVPFAARQKNLILELKTKSDCIENLLDLDHRGKTVIAWSVNPAAFGETEELKCAPVGSRLRAARRVADAGYPIGFHLDPLLDLPEWRTEYSLLVEEIRDLFKPSEIAWISLGSLRYTPGLKNIIRERFPKSRLLHGELFPAPDGKIRYFREIRENLYDHVRNLVAQNFPGVPHYLCMETPRVWERIFGEVPANRDEVEKGITERFMI